MYPWSSCSCARASEGACRKADELRDTHASTESHHYGPSRCNVEYVSAAPTTLCNESHPGCAHRLPEDGSDAPQLPEQPLPERPPFPPPQLGLQRAFPPELPDAAGGDLLMLWSFLGSFGEILGGASWVSAACLSYNQFCCMVSMQLSCPQDVTGWEKIASQGKCACEYLCISLLRPKPGILTTIPCLLCGYVASKPG